jgi:hypothetical protein
MHTASEFHLLKQCGAMIVHALQEATVIYIVIFKSAGGMMRNALAWRHSGIPQVDCDALILSAIHIRRQNIICTKH